MFHSQPSCCVFKSVLHLGYAKYMARAYSCVILPLCPRRAVRYDFSAAAGVKAFWFYRFRAMRRVGCAAALLANVAVQCVPPFSFTRHIHTSVLTGLNVSIGNVQGVCNGIKLFSGEAAFTAQTAAQNAGPASRFFSRATSA